MTGSSRLLIVAPSAYPLGGVQTWLDYLLPGLAAKGWQAVLGLTAGQWHDVETYVRCHPGLDTLAIENPTGSREGRIRAILRAIRQTTPDIVVGVNIPDSYAAVARLRALGGAAPRVVMTIHGIQPDLYEDAHCYRDVLDGVVCTNRLAVQLALAHGIKPAQLHYAPYGVELPPAADTRNVCTMLPLCLAFVGRLEQSQKRVADLPGIMQALVARGVDFELLIAGAGPAETSLRQSLALQESAGRVRFLGSLSSAELPEQVYTKAHALLLTSSWETGPIVIWEAMAHGLAIVSSRYIGAGLEDGLHDGCNCLLFPVGNVEQAAERIVRLSESVLRQRLVHGGHELVSARYTRARSVEAWDRCFRAVLEATPLPVAKEPRPVLLAGRLDRLFGPALGETLRRAVGVRFRHQNPGGEWPHSYGVRSERDAEFWQRALELDVQPSASSSQ